MASAPEANSNEGCIWALGVAVVLALIGGLGKCSAPTTNTVEAATTYNQMNSTLGNSISSQDNPPLEPLATKSVTQGILHFRLAFKAEGLSGAMVYSQNCYDALRRQFSWARLDQCGAFDMMTIRAMPEDDQSDLKNEGTYFAQETAAGRYLNAATSAGEPSDDADTRMSAIQARVSRAPLAKPTLPPPDFSNDSAPPDDSTEDTSE